jgi:hypothetical protein
MLTHVDVDVIRVMHMNTDLTQMLERDRWHQAKLEPYSLVPRWLVALVRWRPAKTRPVASPASELADARRFGAPAFHAPW